MYIRIEMMTPFFIAKQMQFETKRKSVGLEKESLANHMISVNQKYVSLNMT